MTVRLLRILRPRVGWPTFLAVLAAGACFPLAIHAGRWVRGSAVLVELGLAGGVFGSWLAGRRLNHRFVWSLGLVAGGITAFAVIGQSLPPLAFLFQAASSIKPVATEPGFVGELLRALEWVAGVAWLYGRQLALRTQAFAMQISRWVQIALSGGVSRDNDIFLLLVGWLSWAVTFHAAAVFTRKRHPGLALAPTGLAVTAVVASGRGGDIWLFGFLGLGTILLAYGTYQQRERHWIRDQIDYSPDIRLDVTVGGLVLASAVVATSYSLAWGLPWAGDILRRPLTKPTQRVGTTLDRLFGGVRRPPTTGGGWGQADFADLPLTRVLAGPPELRDDPVLRVTVEAADEADVPRVYWRGLTYDQYTGRGWANSVSETARRLPQPVQIAHLGPELTQHVKMLVDAGPVRYAAAQPIRVDVGATWVTRDGSDLVGWYADAVEYTAVSRPTMASVEALRGASSDYPAWVVERYLQLPVDLPERVRRRAQELVGDAATAYEKAVAIEAAMRTIAYSLEVGSPPPDRDVVDHFLFNMDAGYCDYFATTMTVLARATGVPARLSTGYAMGTYDPELGFYVVTGLDAHAWVEVYFPDIGWVPFEPTPARAVIQRSPAPPPVPSSPPGRLFDMRIERIGLVRPALWLIVLAGAGGLGLWVIRRSQAGQLTPEDRVRAAYDAIWRQAGWFGWDGGAVGRPVCRVGTGRPATAVGQTPWERIEALQQALAERSLQVGLGDRHLVWHGADAAEDLKRLGVVFVKAQYSRQGVTPEEAQAARDVWRRVRWRLVLLCGSIAEQT